MIEDQRSPLVVLRGQIIEDLFKELVLPFFQVAWTAIEHYLFLTK